MLEKSENSDHQGGGQVVNMLAFYSVNPSSNPAKDYIFIVG